MGAEVSERARGRAFAQNVTRTRYGREALSYFTLYIMLYTRLNLCLLVTNLFTGPLSLSEDKADSLSYTILFMNHIHWNY